MKTRIGVLLFSCFVFINTAFVLPEKGQVYTSEEGKMSITFPSEYTITKDGADSFQTTKVQAAFKDHTFFIAYTVHKVMIPDGESLAEVSLNAFIDNMPGSTLIQKSVWNVKGYKGVTSIIELEGQNTKVQYQAIIINNIQYQVITFALNIDWNQKLADSFSKSFKLLN